VTPKPVELVVEPSVGETDGCPGVAANVLFRDVTETVAITFDESFSV
jgi:hypothetical protein